MDLLLPSAADTERLGAELARTAPWSAAQALVVFLHGELGAGKTTLVRGLLRELGEAGTVRSPSYTLLETYEPGGHRVLHLDLYRLGGAEEVAALGLRDELDAGVLLLIEWPARASEALPPADLELTLAIAGSGRSGRIGAATAVGRDWLGAVATQHAGQGLLKK
jgi:tRNA threonylcarbamoyladenosine biosynthesis protein TsaE